jgi:hypothetical protein
MNSDSDDDSEELFPESAHANDAAQEGESDAEEHVNIEKASKAA